MKKKLQLRLIESNDIPQLGNIIKAIDGSYFIDGRDYGFMSGDKVIKPIAISDEEIKNGDIVYEEGNLPYVFNARNPNHLEVYSQKVELLPEHFSQDILQLIVDGVLVDRSEIEVEYEGFTYFSGDHHNTPKEYNIKLDSSNHASITIPESYSIGAIMEDTDWEQEERALAMYSTESNFKEVSKEQSITYSEEEVRTLIIEAIESFNDDVDEEVIVSWFNHNKKK